MRGFGPVWTLHHLQKINFLHWWPWFLGTQRPRSWYLVKSWRLSILWRVGHILFKIVFKEELCCMEFNYFSLRVSNQTHSPVRLTSFFIELVPCRTGSSEWGVLLWGRIRDGGGRVGILKSFSLLEITLRWLWGRPQSVKVKEASSETIGFCEGDSTS